MRELPVGLILGGRDAFEALLASQRVDAVESDFPTSEEESANTGVNIVDHLCLTP